MIDRQLKEKYHRIYYILIEKRRKMNIMVYYQLWKEVFYAVVF